MTHGSLFSGIGGFDLAAQWMGWQNIFHCEWNPFGQRVLQHHFPESDSHADITKFDASTYAGRIDIISGGFPCQPYSSAGKRLGKEDERHLWPEMLRVIRECAPRYIVGENVRGLVNWNGGLVFEEVCTDLETAGYDVQPFILPAAGVGAPHRRDRVWFVAHTNHERRCGRSGEVSQTNGEIQKRHTIPEPCNAGDDAANALRDGRTGCISTACPAEQGRFRPNEIPEEHLPHSRRTIQRPTWENFPNTPPVCRGNDGLPTELDNITLPKWRRETIRAFGNAIVPQVAFEIFKAIQAMEDAN